MTYPEIIKHKQAAIKALGRHGYNHYLRIAHQYMEDNKITIPHDGIEYMPGFWNALNEIIKEDTRLSK